MITLTPSALTELTNILSNDFTLEGQYFRLRIEGKGCNGFTYELGFSPKHEKDREIILHSIDDQNSIVLIMDEFTHQYCSDGEINFVNTVNSEDDSAHDEGFTFKNKNEKNYFGKFWKKDELK